MQQQLGVEGRSQNGTEIQEAPVARTIFRIEAYQNYVQNKERVVFPRLASSRGFLVLWVIAGLLLVSGLMVAFWPLLEPYVIGSP